MAISLISSHVCTRRGDKIRAVLTVECCGAVYVYVFFERAVTVP
jgi:hypothetical protein